MSSQVPPPATGGQDSGMHVILAARGPTCRSMLALLHALLAIDTD